MSRLTPAETTALRDEVEAAWRRGGRIAATEQLLTVFDALRDAVDAGPRLALLEEVLRCAVLHLADVDALERGREQTGSSYGDGRAKREIGYLERRAALSRDDLRNAADVARRPGPVSPGTVPLFPVTEAAP